MDLFAVIADPTRRQMIDMLRGGELPAGAFVAAFPSVTQPAISQHLKVLRDSGVAEVRADRQRRLYSLRPGALDTIAEWLAPHLPEPAAEPISPPEQEPEPVEPKPAKPRAKAKPKPKPEPEPTLDLFG